MGETLERVNLSARRRSIIAHLSKGLRQRVGLADAILHKPEIVILDEPTIGLDPSQVREVRELIRSLGKESTVLLSSHILSEVEKTCGRVLIVSRGKLRESGTPDEIARRLMQTGRVRLEIAGDGRAVKEALDRLEGVRNVLWDARGDRHTFLLQAAEGVDLRPALFRESAARGWNVLELAYERHSLEEVFSILTERGGDA